METKSLGSSLSQNSSLSRTTTTNSSNSSSGYVGSNVLKLHKVSEDSYNNNNYYLQNQKNNNINKKLNYSNSFYNQRSLFHQRSSK